MNNLEYNDGSICYAKEIPVDTEKEKILKLMECPVCQEVARPPIFTCIGSHHMICEGCRESLENSECPLCHSAVSGQKCSFAEKAMEHIALPCKYQNQGCKETLKGNMYRDHIDQCPLRPINCVISKCKEKVPFRNYFEHIMSLHKSKVNGIENVREHPVEWWVQGSPHNSARWPPYFLTCYNQVFLYMTISTSHGMWEWVWIIGSEEEAKRFQVISRHIGTEHPIQLEWRGPVHSIRKTIPEIVESGLCFVTNCKEIKNPFLFQKPDEPNYYYWRTFAKIIELQKPSENSIPYLLTTDKDLEVAEGAIPIPLQSGSKAILKENVPTSEYDSGYEALEQATSKLVQVDFETKSQTVKVLEQIQPKSVELKSEIIQSQSKTVVSNVQPIIVSQKKSSQIREQLAQVAGGSKQTSQTAANGLCGPIPPAAVRVSATKISQQGIQQSVPRQMGRGIHNMEAPLPPPLAEEIVKTSVDTTSKIGIEGKTFSIDAQSAEEPLLDLAKQSGSIPLESTTKEAKSEYNSNTDLKNLKPLNSKIVITDQVATTASKPGSKAELNKSKTPLSNSKPTVSPSKTLTPGSDQAANLEGKPELSSSKNQVTNSKPTLSPSKTLNAESDQVANLEGKPELSSSKNQVTNSKSTLSPSKTLNKESDQVANLEGKPVLSLTTFDSAPSISKSSKAENEKACTMVCFSKDDPPPALQQTKENSESSSNEPKP